MPLFFIGLLLLMEPYQFLTHLCWPIISLSQVEAQGEVLVIHFRLFLAAAAVLAVGERVTQLLQ
jgi:hypothetical protein